ncbi:MAG: hypothetical protein PHX05_04915 [Acidobacteriota bacterium]|nr:hypothetical protein [Acidobacteriota bacterium]
MSWIVGLSVWSSSADVTKSGAELIRMYAGHEAVAFVQFFFTEGLPAVTLGIVLVCLARYALAANETLLGRTILAAGLAAAAISFTQFCLGAYLCLSLVPGNRADAAKAVFAVLNRIDGVKMLLMAVFALTGFRLIRNGKARLPMWLAWTSLALAATIFLSGLGFLFLLDSLSPAAYASLPLLMLWVTAVGIVLARSGIRRAEALKDEAGLGTDR